MQERSLAPPGFADDIDRWRKTVGSRAPTYHKLFQELVDLLASDTREAIDLASRLNDVWKSRTFLIFYDRPLLFLASLRLDALLEGPSHPLWSALAAPEPDSDGVTRGALLAALERESVWRSFRTRFVQTNETSRAVAWLWPAEIVGCTDGKRPLGLVEVGAAAGLNLIADHLPSPSTSSSGDSLPAVRGAQTFARLGIDRHPLDVRADDDTNWLRACVWAGENDRLARLEAAIAAFRASPAKMEPGDVADASKHLQALTNRRPERAVVLAFQTIVRDYLDAPTRAAYEEGMRRWLEDSPSGSALWVELELDYADAQKRVPIVAHARDGGDIVLGVTSYHPATVIVDPTRVEQLARLFR
jgi:hypothetical protein